jgi:hypothetical protein
MGLPRPETMRVPFIKLGRSYLRPSLIAWTFWLALTFSPIDIFPIPKALARAKRGEVILGGCIVSGFEPKYYLVW